MNHFEITHLLDLDETIAKEMFEGKTYPWELFVNLKENIIQLGKTLTEKDYDKKIDVNNNPIWIHKNVKLGNYITIEGPSIICENAEIRHSAYIRENVIIGENCIIGNSCELKNSILFNYAQVPHFNYVGDSILGYHSHIGAGVKLSNYKTDGTKVTVKDESIKKETNLTKLGAILGDFVEVGCNTVTNPGTIIGRNTSIYPCLNVRGYVKSNSILKSTKPFCITNKTSSLIDKNNIL